MLNNFSKKYKKLRKIKKVTKKNMTLTKSKTKMNKT